MSKELILTKGKVAIVDDEDYEHLSQWKWHFVASHNGYAARREYPSRKYIYLHRQITNAPKDMDVDHTNNDGLDNRKSNLRVCTTAQNLANRGFLPTRNKSGFKGVSFNGKRWVAQIGLRTKDAHTNKVLGYFDTPEEAARAYDKVHTERYGEFAKPNFEIGG